MESYKLIEYCFLSLFVLFATAKSDGISYKAFDELRVAIKCKVDSLGWHERKALGMTIDQGEIYKIGLPTYLIQSGDEEEKRDCFVELRVASNASSKIIIQFKKSNKGMLIISSKEMPRHDLGSEQKIMSQLSPKYKERNAADAPPTSSYHQPSAFSFNKHPM